MKLATLKNGTRDGRLAVVSRDLTRYTDASFLAPTLQAALDDWQRLSPHLAALSESLDLGAVPSERFHEHDAHSPLPRAYQWADGSAYVNHVELVRKSRGSEMPANHLTDPLIYQGGSDSFLGPRDPIVMADEAWGIDFEGEVAVITGDVPMGASSADAARTRPLAAGTIIGSGTVSNKLDGGPGKPVGEGGAGYSCIVEMRTVETLQHGAAKTPYLSFGDSVRIEMRDKSGHSIFGAI